MAAFAHSSPEAAILLRNACLALFESAQSQSLQHNVLYSTGTVFHGSRNGPRKTWWTLRSFRRGIGYSTFWDIHVSILCLLSSGDGLEPGTANWKQQSPSAFTENRALQWMQHSKQTQQTGISLDDYRYLTGLDRDREKNRLVVAAKSKHRSAFLLLCAELQLSNKYKRLLKSRNPSIFKP